MPVVFGGHSRYSHDVAGASWGSGGLTVQQGGSLSLANVVVAGDITVQGGGSLSISGGSLKGLTLVQDNGMLTLAPTVETTADFVLGVAAGGSYVGPSNIVAHYAKCVQRYTTLNQSWRATSNGAGDHNDFAGVTGGWFRFVGAGGGALPLSSPGENHCGTEHPGWLSGWLGSTAPGSNYNTAGRYPSAEEGVVQMTACFTARSLGGSCSSYAKVSVVQCGDFLLWQLSDVPASAGANSGYCTTNAY